MFWLKKKDDAEAQQAKAEARFFLPIIGTLSIILIIFIVLCLLTTGGMVSNGAKIAETAFRNKKDEVAANIRKEYYDTAFRITEQRYHVSNDVAINITDVREVAKLEVLAVSVTEHSIADKADNDANITSWLEVAVNGVYTVDLQAGEYLVDRARKTVTIRLPSPVLEHVAIENEEKLFFKNDLFNDSQAEGNALHMQQRKEAFEKAKDEMISNPDYIESAENSAKILISDLVQKVNSEVPGLVVEVEFVE